MKRKGRKSVRKGTVAPRSSNKHNKSSPPHPPSNKRNKSSSPHPPIQRHNTTSLLARNCFSLTDRPTTIALVDVEGTPLDSLTPRTTPSPEDWETMEGQQDWMLVDGTEAQEQFALGVHPDSLIDGNPHFYNNPEMQHDAPWEAPGSNGFSNEEDDSVIGRELQSRYKIIQKLGQGRFASTYLAEDVRVQPPLSGYPSDSSHQFVAIKRMKTAQINPIGQDEYTLLQELFSSHTGPRHIVSPVAAFYDDDIFNLVVEPLDSGRPVSLPSVCTCFPLPRNSHSLMACPTRQYTLQKLMCQLLSGLYSLHKHGLIHADLTPSNILYLTSSNRIKIIDLGNAIRPEDREGYMEDFELQSAHYRAPEILLGHGPIEPKMDVWSAGIIILEWLLDTEHRRALENKLTALEGTESGPGSVSSSSTPLMNTTDSTRTAMVGRISKLFGPVICYRNGMYYKAEYDELGQNTPFHNDCHEFGLSEHDGSAVSTGILPDFILDSTLSDGLTAFIADMVTVDIYARKSVGQLLNDKWLVRGLLGEWGNVIMKGSDAVYSEGTESSESIGHSVHPSRYASEEMRFEQEDSGFNDTISEGILVDVFDSRKNTSGPCNPCPSRSIPPRINTDGEFVLRSQAYDAFHHENDTTKYDQYSMDFLVDMDEDGSHKGLDNIPTPSSGPVIVKCGTQTPEPRTPVVSYRTPKVRTPEPRTPEPLPTHENDSHISMHLMEHDAEESIKAGNSDVQLVHENNISISIPTTNHRTPSPTPIVRQVDQSPLNIPASPRASLLAVISPQPKQLCTPSPSLSVEGNDSKLLKSPITSPMIEPSNKSSIVSQISTDLPSTPSQHFSSPPIPPPSRSFTTAPSKPVITPARTNIWHRDIATDMVNHLSIFIMITCSLNDIHIANLKPHYSQDVDDEYDDDDDEVQLL